MMTMLATFKDSDPDSDEQGHSNKEHTTATTKRYHTEAQTHKGKSIRTSKRWLVDDQVRHVYDRIETKEVRKLIYAGGQYSKDKRISKQHYYNISFPKNICTRFGLGKGSLFLWSVVKDQPLTFKLTQVVVDNNNEGGNV